jgi:hypothetical protein
MARAADVPDRHGTTRRAVSGRSATATKRRAVIR